MNPDFIKALTKRLNPVFLSAFLIMIAGLYIPEFFTLAQNRIIAGEPLSIKDIAGEYHWWLFFVLLISIYPSDKIFLKYLGSGSVFLVFYLLVFKSGIFAQKAMMRNEIARFSPSWGFWIFLLGVCFFYSVSMAYEKNRYRRFFFTFFCITPFLILLYSGTFTHFALGREFASQSSRFFSELLNHIIIAYASVLAACMIGIPTGYYAFKSSGKGQTIFYFLNVIQTIPGIALFGLIMGPIAFITRIFPFITKIGISGTGAAPAMTALFLYALLPIVKNTLEGLKMIAPSILESGKGMGMSKMDMLIKVEFPLAMPVILNGARTALVHCVGSTAVAALIGAGGLGMFIFQGIGQGSPDLILLGTLPLIIIAILTDKLMALITEIVSPKGLAI